MSSGSEVKRAEILGELAREFRQFNGLGASFFRAAAARVGMTVTDMQVIDLLDNSGAMSAGQLADLTGLTTGAITGMLNRLEEAGLVRRERDPEDGRRVIVQLERGKDKTHEINSIFDTAGQALDEIASQYDDEQVAFLLEFLKRSNALSRQEIARVREAPEGEGEVFSAPLDNLENARFIFSAALSRLTLRTDANMTGLYQARFEGPAPDVKVREGVVTLRYPRRLMALLGAEKREVEVTLSTAIPWRVMIQGGAAQLTAELGKLDLAALEIKGGVGMTRVELPVPTGVVPIRISGGAAEIFVRRPAGVAARVHHKGWSSTFNIDDQHFNNMGNDVRLQSSGFVTTAPYYDIEVASSVSTVRITAG
jgi:DNA-binding MarR family transcriptional regulator